ncbi:apolipoprotein N-acyltransferase [Deinococcus sp. HMF7604]|uniref:apolipoprotein N-acyltransferase n=1 Tax=Deinococcus betulae TaxID=2873312 RepID=UPI001CC99CBD|nr:apolipoprotein N-acyltransferase [Deinococcus betulae]MBZ9751142.1 apolipoprotein N-acyltransferase [Deinococcus betulae]
MPLPALAFLLGLGLAACGLPLPWSALSALPLAAILLFVARAEPPRQAAGRLFWAGFGYFALHLWWLGAFVADLFGLAPLGLLAGLLFALEGAFLAAMAFLATSLTRSTPGRVWTLAGGWVLLEWLRFLGPLAFPWPTLGYTLLPTPAIQIADLGGVLLGSVLVSFTAAALAHAWLGWQQGRAPLRPAMLAAVGWALALGYGLTRTPGEGPEQPMRVMRVTFDSFARAADALTAEEEFPLQRKASLDRPAGSVVVWSESAIRQDNAQPGARVPNFPGPGLSGTGGTDWLTSSTGQTTFRQYNRVASLNARGEVLTLNDKGRPVPFGETRPFELVLSPVYNLLGRVLGLELGNIQGAQTLTPLALNGVQYGAYICYDSVFPWVSRTLANKGAELLVNPSNDGWYKGWGVQQHFNMGRVRAIETRRWLVRSVNNGVAGSVDDLGRPVQTVQSGDTVQVLDVRPKRLSGTTLYMRLGDWPALLLALGMVVYGWRQRGRIW